MYFCILLKSILSRDIVYQYIHSRFFCIKLVTINLKINISFEFPVMRDNQYLVGNFAPLEDELTTETLSVTGKIPQELDGCLARIGPNPIDPDPTTHHWFLGSGMVHGLYLRDGKALKFHSRFVRDDDVVEKFNLPEISGPRGSLQLGSGVVNTNIMKHAGKTFALVEAGNLPIEMNERLDTIQRTNLEGTLPGGFSAHPHFDPDTGELHAAVYSPLWHHIQHLVIDNMGLVNRAVDVPVPGQPMVHDCMITKQYFILLDLPVILDQEIFEAGFSLPYKWHPEYGARIGLLPRDGAAHEVTWHEVEPCYVFHPMNAFEDESGTVIIDVVRHSKMFDKDRLGPSEGIGNLYRWEISSSDGKVRESQIDDAVIEFPRINESRIGKNYRYGYVSTFTKGFSPNGLKKYDLVSGRSEIYSVGDHKAFMEPVFIAKENASEEDDGWLLSYSYDQNIDSSDVVILDACNISDGPVATIHLPRRVPFGFHGNWL